MASLIEHCVFEAVAYVYQLGKPQLQNKVVDLLNSDVSEVIAGKLAGNHASALELQLCEFA